MAKAKTNAKQNNLAMLRDLAQFVTVGAAVLNGILWAVVGMVDDTSASLDKLSNVLITVMVISGITMGLLYALSPDNKK